MPSSVTVGQPSEANNAIGGVPAIHYLDFLSRGRGQVVRLLWEDAGIAYRDVRYSDEELQDPKVAVTPKKNPVKTLPVVELNGKTLTQSYAILRHIARLLGKYDGETEEEKYWTDVICDIGIDWRTLFVQAFFSPTSPNHYENHKKTDRARFLAGLESHLTSNELSKHGPFVLGDRITYADLVIYQDCHDEGLTQDGRQGLKEYPRLTQLVDGVEQRPNVKVFLASDRYRG
ncbi:hypothetical protein MMC14_001857 [Varicellaria rhodocarpa]|nr:hypothetical protein [Varicellaria rhodocarpa]